MIFCHLHKISDRPESAMYKKICIILLLLIINLVSAHGIDIDFTWSLGDIGLGWGFTLFDYHDYHGETFYLFPVEAMWHPWSKMISKTIYGTLGFYDKIRCLSDHSTINDLKFVNTTGIRFMFSSIPLGRSVEKGKWQGIYGNGAGIGMKKCGLLQVK